MSTRAESLLTLAGDAVGTASVTLGGLLAVAPRSGARRLGLGRTGVDRARALGLSDVSLGVAVIGSRRSRARWLAVGARSLLHLVFAREYVRNRQHANGAAMTALFVVDSAIAYGLRRTTRG